MFTLSVTVVIWLYTKVYDKEINIKQALNDKIDRKSLNVVHCSTRYKIQYTGYRIQDTKLYLNSLW